MKQAWQKGGNGGGEGDEGQKLNAARTSVAPSCSQNEVYLLREPRAQAGAGPTLRTLVFNPSFDSEACQLPGAEKKWLLVLFLSSLCF